MKEEAHFLEKKFLASLTFIPLSLQIVQAIQREKGLEVIPEQFIRQLRLFIEFLLDLSLSFYC